VTGPGVSLVVVEDAEAAARATAERLAAAAAAGAQVALTGGSTPRRAYELAARLEPDWSRAAVWWGDERCVGPDDERSNYRLAREALLDRLERQPEVHRIRGELDSEEAAQAYERELDGTVLDLVLLGVGPDGHTASLFPGAPALDERERRVVASKPGLDPWVDRVTLTLPALSSGQAVVFLITGEEKADAVRRAFGEEPSTSTPASLVRAREGPTEVVLDRAAARLLPR
jgi:6-phosphogluconolactonase